MKCSNRFSAIILPDFEEYQRILTDGENDIFNVEGQFKLGTGCHGFGGPEDVASCGVFIQWKKLRAKILPLRSRFDPTVRVKRRFHFFAAAYSQQIEYSNEVPLPIEYGPIAENKGCAYRTAFR